MKRTRSEAGFTVVEVLIAVTITVILGIGVSSTFASSITSVSSTRNTAFTSSGSATLTSVFTRDVESANGFLVANGDSVDNISAVSANGTTVTYTYSAKNTLNVGQNISVNGISPSGYNALNAQVQSVSASAHTFTLNNATTGAMTASGTLVTQCTSWSNGDSTFTNVRPLITLSQQAGAPITSASGNGSVMTFTYSGPVSFAPGQTVTTSGMVPTAYNVINSTILSVNPGTQTFTVSGTGTGALTSAGILIYNNFIGYEVRSSLDKGGQLWRLHCAVPGVNAFDASAQLLRSWLPVPASDNDWSSALQCASYSGAAVTATSCPTNTFLSSSTTYPGVKLTLPATSAAATNYYPIQVILASRSIA